VPQFAPDAIIEYFNLPGLSEKDLHVTLVSKGVNVPVIVLSRLGTEEDVIQTFRLGAFDYLIWPMREAEVVAAVDRFLNQMCTRREREHLTRQLKETSNELQQRLNELELFFNLGKAVAPIVNQRALFDKIIEGAVRVTETDIG